MFFFLSFSVTAFLVFLFTFLERAKNGIIGKKFYEIPPGPRPWPVLGSLHLMGQASSPFEVFTKLSKTYGSIYSITLGSSSCVVVNSFSLIKKVLISKGGHFGGRPDFIRFHKLFGGDRNNSLALCDWSDLQKTRRSIARLYCSPRFASTNYDRLKQVGLCEMSAFLNELSSKTVLDSQVNLKPLVMATCANMFTSYMCSTRFSYDDKEFIHMVHLFDEIFWEINQGYAVDFLPWLLPFYKKHMNRLSNWSKEIRQFILSRIIDHHRSTLDLNAPPRDFTDALLLHLEEDEVLNWQHIIFELEDFLGGHSAIGNLVMLALAAIVKNPEVGVRIQEEVDRVVGTERPVNLFDKPEMPYTEATILETLRTSSSPIVPHVANQDTMIEGYFVKKGSVVFLNNYELNTGEEYWSEPLKFKPERFVSNNKIIKPEFFIPFSTGKRTCIGQRLVQGFSFVLLATILQNYNVTCSDLSTIKLQPACVALPPSTFSLTLTSRTKDGNPIPQISCLLSVILKFFSNEERRGQVLIDTGKMRAALFSCRLGQTAVAVSYSAPQKQLDGSSFLPARPRKESKQTDRTEGARPDDRVFVPDLLAARTKFSDRTAANLRRFAIIGVRRTAR